VQRVHAGGAVHWFRAKWLLLLIVLSAFGCRNLPHPGLVEHRQGDEIVVAGQFVHTGTRVVLWMDPGGYDAYRVERRFAPWTEADWEKSKGTFKDVRNPSPNRYSLRDAVLTPDQIEKVRGGGWDLPLLQSVVDQFVYHFDASGTSRQCFKVLQDLRDLSVHFMLDVDGTIYQTLDLKEKAWHATTSNSRSVGIEIANIGAFPLEKPDPLTEWYKTNAQGQVFIQVPEQFEPGFYRTNFVPHPARANPIQGTVQNQDLLQFDFTPEQYQALIKLTVAVCKMFPRIRCDFPRDEAGQLITHKLPDADLRDYHGLLGHYHIQENKIDPGPAFQWDYVISEVRKRLTARPTPDEHPAGNARMHQLFGTTDL